MTIINNLNNNISNYPIILSNKIIPSIFPTFYIFGLFNSLQYNNIEFKELDINLGAVKTGSSSSTIPKGMHSVIG